MYLPYDPTIPLLGNYPREIDFFMNVHNSFISNSQTLGEGEAVVHHPVNK